MENERRELPFLARPPENSDPTSHPTLRQSTHPSLASFLYLPQARTVCGLAQPVIPTEGPRCLRAEVEGS